MGNKHNVGGVDLVHPPTHHSLGSSTILTFWVLDAMALPGSDLNGSVSEFEFTKLEISNTFRTC